MRMYMYKNVHLHRDAQTLVHLASVWRGLLRRPRLHRVESGWLHVPNVDSLSSELGTVWAIMGLNNSTYYGPICLITISLVSFTSNLPQNDVGNYYGPTSITGSWLRGSGGLDT